MSQREAFEAAIRKSYQSQQVASEVLERMDSGRYVVDSIENKWQGFQLAIQHARDVAGVACLNVASPLATPYADGYNQGAIDCYDSIKEALK